MSGTRSSSTSNPPHSRAISATEQESPPAPLSVMELYRPRSRASFTIASESFFWVMGSPICTAAAGLPYERASDEKVAPCIPSRPTRPPTITILSPGMAFFLYAGLPSAFFGRSPTVPTNTSGFPLYRSSK